MVFSGENNIRLIKLKFILVKKSCKFGRHVFRGYDCSKKISWKDQITHFCKKITTLIGILSKTRNVHNSCLVISYNSLIYRFLTYCNIVGKYRT